MGSDPPGDDTSDSYVGDAVDLDRPLICSNPSSYASKPSRGSTRSGGSVPTTGSGSTRDTCSSAAHANSEASSMHRSRHHQQAVEGVIDCGSVDDSLLPSPAIGTSPTSSPRIRLSRAEAPLEEAFKMIPDTMPYGNAHLRLSASGEPEDNLAELRHPFAISPGEVPLECRAEADGGTPPDVSPGALIDPAFRRTLTARAKFHDESFADPVISVIGRRGSFGTEWPEDGTTAGVGQPGVGGGGGAEGGNPPLIYWEDDPPVDPNDKDRLVDRRVVGQQLQLLKLRLSKSMHSDTQDGSGGTRDTEGLTDEHTESYDGDDDIEEEHYRELPPARICAAPHAEVQAKEKKITQRGLEPEEYTGEENRLVVKGPEEKAEGRPRNRSSISPKKAAPEERMVVRKDKVYPKEKFVHPNTKAVAKADPQERQLAFAPEPLTDLSERYNGYRHCFITIEEEHRFLMLYTFLKRNIGAKIILFFSTTKSTQYYSRLLQRLKFDARAIHNGMSKERFMDAFLEFSKRTEGILCLPDFQGGDLAIPPTCDWIVQYEPPADPSEYIFRVGRISSENKGDNACRALLFLTPPQFGFLQYYKAARVRVYEYEIPKISNVQKELERLLKEDGKLGRIALEAYRAYIMAYASHEYRDIYNVHELDQKRVAKCFGFDKLPSKEAKEDTEVKVEKDGKEEKRTSREESPAKEKGVKPKKDPNSCSFSGWKPKKAERTGWMKGEKTWRASGVHADKTRVKGAWGKTNPDEYKPKTVKLR